MNTTHTNQGFIFRDSQAGSGNTVAFLFGAVFNLLANTDYTSLIDYSIKAVIGGIVMMLFKLLGDYVSKVLFKKKKIDKVGRRYRSLRIKKSKNVKN